MRSTVRMGVVLVVVVLSGIFGSAEQTSIDWDDHIVHLFEENSILRYEIDWDVFRAQVEKIARPYNLGTASERLQVFRRMFELLEGHCDVHSGLVLPGIVEENQAAWADGRTPHAPGEDLENPYGINARILEGGFAYIAIPPDFSARILGVEESIAKMGYELVRLVRVLDAERPQGWIVDLRADFGGYEATRWIGFHPLLVEGRLYGHAIPAADGAPQIVDWLLFRDGVFLKAAASSGGLQSESVLYDLGEHRYALRNSSTPVAVLAGSGTASAGEYAPPALRQNPRVRVFGRATHGATTAMSGFELEDGSLLLIAAAYMVDPSGHVFAAATRAPWAVGSLLASGSCVAKPLQPDVAVAMRTPFSTQRSRGFAKPRPSHALA